MEKTKRPGPCFEFCDWELILLPASAKLKCRVLNMEHGGMNEVYADAYHITGDKKYLEAAKIFSPYFLDPLSKGVDNLDNWHANTQIPKFVGFARIAELDGDDIYEKAARFSWETVVNNRTIAFGGNSRREHFPSASSCIDYVNDVDGPETCNTYNMLRLTENLFRMDPSAHYVDYYERALFNHIFSTQHPEHGAMSILLLPVRVITGFIQHPTMRCGAAWEPVWKTIASIISSFILNRETHCMSISLSHLN